MRLKTIYLCLFKIEKLWLFVFNVGRLVFWITCHLVFKDLGGSTVFKVQYQSFGGSFTVIKSSIPASLLLLLFFLFCFAFSKKFYQGCAVNWFVSRPRPP